jgi:uncharacterized membrane protein (GlpM family)
VLVHDVLVLGLKAVLGGCFVVAFAVLSDAVHPKSFAGIFGAAPSIALASLLVTVADKGVHSARVQSLSMMFGALAMVAYCVTAVRSVDRFGALRGSAVAFVTWSAVAALAFVVVVAVS